MLQRKVAKASTDARTNHAATASVVSALLSLLAFVAVSTHASMALSLSLGCTAILLRPALRLAQN